MKPLDPITQTVMTPTENVTHSFVIRFWLEETSGEEAQRQWRGHITHIPGGERTYLKTMDDLSAFVWSYLGNGGQETEPVEAS